MDLEQVKEAVRQAAKGGVLTCHDARALAEELGVEYSLVGQACNEVGVKVRSCELGCF
jgi:phosphoribosylformimino-5-aminoimidazole carboxamide ribonucleotide (ProFAR) isomerase